MKKIVIILFFIPIFSFSQYFIPFLEDSIYRNSGYYATIGDIFVDNNNLYIVGNNGVEKGTNGVVLNEVAKWNGSSWQAMDNGLGHSGWLYSIQKYHNKIYIGGNFDDIDGVANTENIGRFNGTTWEALPNSNGVNGIGGNIYDLTIWNDMLIIGGGFTGIVVYNDMPYVVAYNDTDFVDINDGDLGAIVFAVTVFNGELYAADGTYMYLKKYVGNKHWEPVGGHIGGYVKDMFVDTFNNFLYVVGGFSVVDDSIHCDNTAFWDGYKWTGLGTGINTNNEVQAACLYNGEVYISSSIDTINGYYTGYLAKWNGTNWEPGIPGGIDFWVNSLAVYNDQLWIGGGAPVDGNNYCPMDTARKTLARWYLPPTINCNYLQPRIQSHTDTFFVNQAVQIHNNNAYVDTWQWNFGDGGTAAIQNPYHTYTDTGTYTVSLEVNWQTCNKTIQRDFVVIEDTTNTINSIQNTEQSFKIYPNPSKNLLFLEIKDEKLIIKNQTVQIIDINGKEVSRTFLFDNKISIDISQLQKGTYFVKIGNQTQRFVKE